MTGQSSMQLQKYDGASYRKKAFSHMKEARLHLDGRLKGEVVLLFHCKQQEGLLTRTKEMVSNEKKEASSTSILVFLCFCIYACVHEI